MSPEKRETRDDVTERVSKLAARAVRPAVSSTEEIRRLRDERAKRRR